MLRRQIPALTATILLILPFPLLVDGQGRSGRRTKSQQSPAPSPAQQTGNTASAQKQDSWWAAQRSIEAAIQQLETYLKEFPNGERATTARQQLEVLRSLSLTASRPEWVRMNTFFLSNAPDWRVASVDPQTARTRVSVEINCRREDGTDCYFDPFDRHPLVLIDNAGRFYPQVEAGDLPPDIKFKDDGKAILSVARIITQVVDFAPLTTGTVSGQVYYRDKNEAQPARFSLSHQK